MEFHQSIVEGGGDGERCGEIWVENDCGGAQGQTLVWPSGLDSCDFGSELKQPRKHAKTLIN